MSNNPFTFLSLPHRRTFLTIGISKRLRDKFSRIPNALLPSIQIYTKAEINVLNRKGSKYPDTGWFDFTDRSIGIVVDENENTKTAYIRTAGIDVHENLHWLYNLSPGVLGVSSNIEMRALNIFLDGSNEQRASIVDPFSRKYLVDLRKLLLEEHKLQPFNYSDNSCAATLQHILLIHTMLLAKKMKLTRIIHKEKNPKKAWKNMKAESICSLPDNIKPFWEDAFCLTLKIWCEFNEWIRLDLVREFLALFPSPEVPSSPSLLQIGGEHIGGDMNNLDYPPPGCDPSDLIPPSQTNNQSQNKDENDGKSEPNYTTNPTGNSILIDPIEISASSQDDEDEYSDETSIESEISEIVDEINNLNAESIGIEGSIFSYKIPIKPECGTELLHKAAPLATILAQGLKISMSPTRKTFSKRGRLDIRRIVSIPDCTDPFTSKEIEQISAAPGSFWGLMVDISASKFDDDRWKSSQLAAATFHLACQSLGIKHQVVTSVSLEIVAGLGVTDYKAIHLLAGTKPTKESIGDNYYQSIPTYLEFVQRRPEIIKGIIIETDGMPGNIDMITNIVNLGRNNGIIIVGVGIDLNEYQSDAMRMIFGSEYLVLSSNKELPSELSRLLTTLAIKHIARCR